MALQDEPIDNVVLGIHGGIGWTKAESSPALEAEVRAGLTAALEAGWKTHQAGGNCLDVTESAVRSLEDTPVFNAGRGSVFNHDGQIELDAAIMEGADRLAGAIAGVSTIRNPITAARAVMERSSHVLLIGAGAEAFARAEQLDIVDPAYFATQPRSEQLQRQLAAERGATTPTDSATLGKQYGTVGAVARDGSGRLAAATSTGGMSNKRFGRVGDTPIIGAGTYADNRAGAISCTGHGEYFIRFAVAHEILSLVRLAKVPLPEALRQVVMQQLAPAGGEGGVIALSPTGMFVAGCNSEGMYRGAITRSGRIVVRLYED